MNDQQKKLAGFGGVAAAGLFLYSRMHAKPTTKTATPISNSSATGSITPYTPQSPLPLQAGESIYDPNSEALLTTPAGRSAPFAPGDMTFHSSGDGQSAVAAAPSYVVNVTYPSTVKTVKQTVKPTKRVVAKKPVKPAKKKVAK